MANINNKNFETEYKKLNKEQKEAVDSIDGPVMVVAGPGTGKTQILALRIANILNKTDIGASGILCLTFTNSAVEAMKERLVRYIGDAGEAVNVFTFHSFGMQVISEHFRVLGFPEAPKLLDETEAALFFHEILNTHDWVYLRPRADSTRYYHDLRSLISLMKRERISREDFEKAIEKELTFLQTDESSISSRGETKGGIKKEIQNKIEGLQKTKEVAKFLELYEDEKIQRGMIDYDDVLEYLVELVEIGSEVRAQIQERYLYVLVDEHQDSSRAQNEFLAKVWDEVPKPDIFVVGDDRQLIYGFSGASIDHFKGFRKTFPSAKLIPLVQNYRSTQVILDAAHALLKSVMTKEKLVSENKEHHPIKLIEVDTPYDEIMAVAEDLKEKIKEGLSPSSCAILVPKNLQVRDAIQILHKERLPVATHETLSLFDQKETAALLRVLKIIDSGDVSSLALSFFDECSLVAPIDAHTFFAGEKMREFGVQALFDRAPKLFEGNSVEKWIAKLAHFKQYALHDDVKTLIQKITEELFPENKEKLITGKEIIDTILSLLEKRPSTGLHDCILYLARLELYGEVIPILSDKKDGIKVLTMHSSKGLEFDYVWIAHMDEKSLSGGKRLGFTLPEIIAEKIEERDIDAIKRKLFVAITRAKCFCTLSYATGSKKGIDQELAKVIVSLPLEVFEKHTAKIIQKKKTVQDLSKLSKLVMQKYADRYISAWLLNNFFECPWKWYFQNLLQLPEEGSESMEFGGNVHKAVDKILQFKGKISAEILEKYAVGDKAVLKILSGWVKDRLPEIAVDRANEQPISVQDKKFPHFKMYGRIDLIEKLSRDSLRVTDFKTGSPRKKSEIEKLDEEGRFGSNMRQLAMYSYLLNNSPAWRGTNVSESRLEFLEAKSPRESFYDTFIDDKKIDLLLKDISDYDALIKSGEWLKRPCNYNSYGKNIECPYCKIAEIYV